MTNSTNAPLVGRRKPAFFDDLFPSWKAAALHTAKKADRRNGDAMIAEQLGDPISQHEALVAYLDSLDFNAASWVADYETSTADDLGFEPDDDNCGDWLSLGQLDLIAAIAADVANVAADLDLADDPDMPGWGDVFNPEDLQWGFTVRTRF